MPLILRADKYPDKSWDWYCLTHNPNRILNEDQLKDYLYGVNEDVSSNALNVHLFNLRKKVGKNIIVTERGLGFRLASIEEQSQ